MVVDLNDDPGYVPNRDPHTGILKTLANPLADAASSSESRTWQWATPQIEGKAPCARGGHTATLVTSTSAGASAKVVVFGGHYNDNGYNYLNDVYILDVDENTWTEASSRGTPPESRYGHSASLVGSRIVYFGGRGKDNKHFRDLHALDVATLTWYQGPSSGGAPAARIGHTSTLYETNLYIFGGVCGTKYFDGLHCLDLSSMAWRNQETTGPSPCGRMGHTAVLMDTNLIIHGGFALPVKGLPSSDVMGDQLSACYFNDMRVLDLEKHEWSRLRTHGTPMAPRFSHTLVVSGQDLVCFGGWNGAYKKQTEEDAAANPNELNSGDFLMNLRTTDMTWSQCPYTGIPPAKRYLHTCTTIGPHLILFGGFDGGKALNDLVVLRETTVAEGA